MIASEIGIALTDVFLVGSAAFGRSTNPSNDRFSNAFGEDSDLDVVIISNGLFHDVWGQLNRAYYSGYPAILDFHGKNVFRRFVIEPDRDFQSTLLRDLIKRTHKMKREVELKTSITTPLKFRIYCDFESAVAYHTHGFEKCKRKAAA